LFSYRVTVFHLDQYHSRQSTHVSRPVFRHHCDKSNDITICLHHFTALSLSVVQAILVIDSARTFVRPSRPSARPSIHPSIYPSIHLSIPSIRHPSTRELNAAFSAMQEAAIIVLFFLCFRVVPLFSILSIYRNEIPPLILYGSLHTPVEKRVLL